MTPVDDLEGLVVGALELERTPRGWVPHRLPAWARAQLPDPQLLMAESQPAGVRLALRTAATALELDTIPTKRAYVGAPPRPDGTYDVLVDGRLVHQGSVAGGDVLEIDLTSGRAELRQGGPGTLRIESLETGVHDVEIWLPHDETTLLVALRADAPVEPLPDRGRRVWLHHGSSISQGSNAASPTGTWPAVAAARGGVDLVNLGFGGGAMLDPATARAMAHQPADLLSVEIGINLVNADVMRRRAFTAAVHGFLDLLRDGHPETPLVVVSAVLCPIHEDTPGPSALDPASLATGTPRFTATGDPADVPAGRLTLRVVREELARIVDQRASTDPHLVHLDGRELYGVADAARLPLPDGLHPDAATHRLIGERFAALVLTGAAPAAPVSAR